jgi:hypothetical protein
MTTGSGNIDSGGKVLIAIPLLSYGLFSAVTWLSGPPGLLRVLTVSFGLWMVVVAHLLLLTDRLGHYFAVPTYAWLALNSIYAVVTGFFSKAALIWSAICVAAVVYSVMIIRRKAHAHAI